MTKHILLIGFKNVGKSSVGKELASQLGRNFVDLDEEVEKLFESQQGHKLTCRQIMLKIGQNGFRQLEHKALMVILASPAQSIISLGGGTPTFEPNTELMLPHDIIHVVADKNIVYNRIMLNGRPAFFSPDEHPLVSFDRMWEERSKIYEQLTKNKVDNSTSVKNAVAEVKKIINQPV